MSDFAESRARSYGLLKGCETSPSPDTFERLMRAVSPAEIERCLMQYGKQFLDTLVEKQVALCIGTTSKCHFGVTLYIFFILSFLLSAKRGDKCLD